MLRAGIFDSCCRDRCSSGSCEGNSVVSYWWDNPNKFAWDVNVRRKGGPSCVYGEDWEEIFVGCAILGGAEPVEVVEGSHGTAQEAGGQPFESMVCVPTMKDGNQLRHLRNWHWLWAKGDVESASWYARFEQLKTNLCYVLGCYGWCRDQAGWGFFIDHRITEIQSLPFSQSPFLLCLLQSTGETLLCLRVCTTVICEGTWNWKWSAA